MKAAHGPVARVADVPSLGVTRIVIELPIEFHVAATALLHGQRVLVTVAGAELAGVPYGIVDGSAPPEATAAAATIPAVERAPKGGKLCMDAAVICDDKLFQKFAAQTHHDHELEWKAAKGHHFTASEGAARMVRQRCGIESRAELDHNPDAARRFAGLMREFREWKRRRAPA